MKKFLGYIFTPLHLLGFGLVLVVFHPIQWLNLKLGGYSWHKKTVDLMNLCLTRSLWLLGVHCRFRQNQQLGTDRPLIIVSNHQSLYDIPPFFWFFRKHHVKFVSKIELEYGIPSVSYNLRHGGSVCIDRKNPRQALPALKAFGEYIEKNNYAACIFPEGTRSRDGKPKKFSPRGLKILLKYAPSALIVPVTINDSWKLVQYGAYPMSFGEQPTWTVHPAIDPKGRDVDELIIEVQGVINGSLKEELITS
ncbi:MAG: 1-acyl-sn-glycerol-3-phosphate acyltransferase [Bacteroidetes bacterium]|nr:1-acyl-sn-glycerol-3-phosphate acyltransferase [Bacteroidota bacterium]MCB0845849.1 1-acyl-sn-glycerol-3-phosphate acyltransferase [Bacteroidota bacterium]